MFLQINWQCSLVQRFSMEAPGSLPDLALHARTRTARASMRDEAGGSGLCDGEREGRDE